MMARPRLQQSGRLHCVVVEDQPIVRDHLVSLLQALDVTVLGTCADGPEAVARIPALAPDVVFLDIQLPELSGFEVIEAIGIDAMPPVVFITAYDAYAMRAFDVFALGYLLKPVTAERLGQVVGRMRSEAGIPGSRLLARRLARLLGEPAIQPGVSRLVVRQDGRLVLLATKDVEWVAACGNYAIIHAQGDRYYARLPLQTLERRLGIGFVRIHRSSLVNLAGIAEVRATPDGDYTVVTSRGTVLPVARRFRRALEEGMRRLP
jgi:two-component system LytT family response regulator